MNFTVTKDAPAADIFRENVPCSRPHCETPEAPIAPYCGYIVPGDDESAKALGAQCAAEIRRNIIADFERTPAYCAAHRETNPDLMVHVSTFKRIDGTIYMTYYANTGSGAEDPKHQEARFAFCPADDPRDMTIVQVQKVGDTLDGKVIDALYDTILLYKGGDALYILWTASAGGQYYRFYCTYSIAHRTLSAIRPNRFRVGSVTNDFSITGIQNALANCNIPYKKMFSDIGIMQKLTSRVENGVPYYYTGAYSGYFNCIIKSADLITWEYVAAPDFINLSMWENAVYVIGNRCYCFVRQHECMQGFLTYYDLDAKTWATPCLIRDAQSRSDFIVYDGALYLIHAPLDRNGFGIVRVNPDDLARSVPVLVADMQDSLFYPYAEVHGGEMYLSYTVDRKHIRLARVDARKYLKG